MMAFGKQIWNVTVKHVDRFKENRLLRAPRFTLFKQKRKNNIQPCETIMIFRWAQNVNEDQEWCKRGSRAEKGEKKKKTIWGFTMKQAAGV